MSEIVKQLGFFAQAAGGVFTGLNLLIIAAAVLLGLVVGAIPGLTGTMALALLINITYTMPTSSAVAFMLGVYVGAVSGGLFSAIMLNIPGTPNAAATALDGFPLAKQGKGGKAIFGGVFASFWGTLLSCVLMMLATPILYKIALKFGKWELFLLSVFGITICGNLSVDSTPLKGWIGGFLGFFCAMIGVDQIYNGPRFIWTPKLTAGVTLIPALIGLFGIAEVLCVLQDRTPYQVQGKVGSIFPDKNELKSLMKPVLRSSLIGCGIGALKCDSWKAVVDAIPSILKLGVVVGAVMELIPRITGLFIEGLKPICQAVQEKLAKRFGAGFSIGMSPALVIGHPTTLVVSILLIPVILFLSVLLPGNKFLPLASLAGVFYLFPCVLPITKGNVLKTFIVGLVALIVGLYFVTDLTPAFTKAIAAAKCDGIAVPEGFEGGAALDFASAFWCWVVYHAKIWAGVLAVAMAAVNWRRIRRSQAC